MLSPSTIEVVKNTVEVVREHGTAITGEFYRSMFEAHPELTNLFNMSNQIKGEQKQALASAVYAYAANYDNAALLNPILNRIAHKHASLGIQPAQYTIVGKYLLAAVKTVLGDAVTDEVAVAWDEVYWQLACDLISREAQLYALAGCRADDGYWQSLVLEKKVKECDGVYSLYLSPAGTSRDASTALAVLPEFKPGQYLSVALEHQGQRQIRQYSLSQLSVNGSWRITVKQERAGSGSDIDGWLSNKLVALEEGALLQVGQPFGDFIDEQQDKDLVLISGGIGITPMVALWQQRAAKRSAARTMFIHGARSADNIALLDDVMDAAPALSNGQLIVFAESGSRAGLDIIEGVLDLSEIELPKKANYMLCGPVEFMRVQRRFLLGCGVDAENIKYELFGPDMFAGLK
ncbi:globin domain-containing protein [Agaribacterium haliotis]|uniref:globin domain-containing protein n=1 Tax=Agaribacterium haliotis TaxID=2013869 RepID=UPI000BB56270|nr:globin domain-containing protein [Agaribacterium haliotis]